MFFSKNTNPGLLYGYIRNSCDIPEYVSLYLKWHTNGRLTTTVADEVAPNPFSLLERRQRIQSKKTVQNVIGSNITALGSRPQRQVCPVKEEHSQIMQILQRTFVIVQKGGYANLKGTWRDGQAMLMQLGY